MKSNVITIFQDYTCKIPDHVQHAENLYALRDLIGHNCLTLHNDGRLQVMHYVGFFQKGNTRLQILPKVFANAEPEKEKEFSLEFIYRLLNWSGYLGRKDLLPQFQGSSGGDLLEIFINLFAEEMKKVFSKRVLQSYVDNEDNLQFIKGKILFSETVRRNPVVKHRHYVRFGEYTVNNVINRVFKSVAELLLKKTNSGLNRSMLRDGLYYLDDVDSINLSGDIFGKVKFDRLNSEFEPLFNLAKLFFSNLQPGLTEGTNRTISFLVPLHKLFERLLAKVLEDFTDEKYVFDYHKPKSNLALFRGKDIFPLEPDFTISENGRVISILDAKYKNPIDEKGNLSIGTQDLYQLATYALHYDCNSLFLIYPKFLGYEDKGILLGEYIIKSAFGPVKLQILQVDIMERDISLVKEGIRKAIYP